MTSDVRARTDPSIETARSVVEAGLESGAVVTIFGECTVEYDGRAASTLGPGDRHVMCKPDGTVLVHTDEGHQPVNWQPPGCTREVTVDGGLVVESHRDNPDEQLVVEFEAVEHVAAFDVTDPEELSLSGTEEDLRQRILDDPSLIESGFIPLATERRTSAGAVDVYGEDEDGRAVVLELKRRRVGPDAVGQLARYVEALQRDLHAETGVRGILVAPSVTDRARSLLAERGLEFVALEP
ncbi:endonuclease NucS [Halapricum desulfuricans]|uniref:Endonuclease NucS n=1 Tax=Halapricum desulfuricans TaxID=2841257 RepID=A0A897NJ10_9EURY|nr:endonuclease NucS [Halapricum desulfuricans]QSG08450.1 RecB family endonuclease acting on branched DNA substrates [Halapricum desulfuricans]QSG12424.1 RecB family endonuclease acting on branched DNA substrates [Halapricum desulfuricans]